MIQRIASNSITRDSPALYIPLSQCAQAYGALYLHLQLRFLKEHRRRSPAMPDKYRLWHHSCPVCIQVSFLSFSYSSISAFLHERLSPSARFSFAVGFVCLSPSLDIKTRSSRHLQFVAFHFPGSSVWELTCRFRTTFTLPMIPTTNRLVMN